MRIYNEEYVYQVIMEEPDRQKIDEIWDSVDDPIWIWCDETFGEDMWYSEYKEVSDIDVFYFKKEEHRSWFLIRWAV